jgi:hypothetical protein
MKTYAHEHLRRLNHTVRVARDNEGHRDTELVEEKARFWEAIALSLLILVLICFSAQGGA